MADPNNVAQYKYSAMSNLVLQADRRFVTQRRDEATGDPESLAGRINLKEMGSRAVDSKKKRPEPAMPRLNKDMREGETALQGQRKRKREQPQQITSAADMLVEGLRYTPRSGPTRQVYEIILSNVRTALGNMSSEDVVYSAADAVLEYLKDADMKDLDKKREIDELLGSTMTSKEFNELVNLGKKITDYDADDDEGGDADGAELDERQGVAVAFDESDEDVDEDGIAHAREVVEHGSESEGDSESEDGGIPARDADAEDETDGLVIDAQSRKQQSKAEQGLLNARDIDAFWLQRQVGEVYSDPHEQQEKTTQALTILDNPDAPLRDVENDLMELFDYEHHQVVERLMTNKDRIVLTTRWRQAAEDSADRKKIEASMADSHPEILAELHGDEAEAQRPRMKLDLMDVDMPSSKGEARREVSEGGLQPKKVINLDNLVFEAGNHLMSNAKLNLPKGTTRQAFKGYEEIKVPAPKRPKDDPQRPDMPTTEMPEWARVGFGSSQKLNRIQTRCYPAAFESDRNLLICAPTGSGKTNVAMLTILREIGRNRNPETGEIYLNNFKIIYIAPLKALVQEQVGNFGKRLSPYGIQVSELTGDRQLTKQQIADTQIIVTTPEKYDVITRKATDTSYTNLVRLVIIDEIHLLHDERGPVLESIVSRTIRKVERTGDAVRIVGLSATLPNFRDVASFIRADPEEGVFHFDSTFRPCPLQQEFIGVTDKKPIKQLKTMNDVCYAKVLEQVGTNKQQLLIFVHSRKDTAKTAKHIRDKALEMETIGQILRSDAASREILQEEAETVQDRELKDILPYGFGIHHAGMSRADRNSVEELFAEGMIQVLVCTATLAWGVNLPAHTVIIKGTQVYSPEKGSWVELSPQDVLQMLGRAGRPQYDTYGEGIIITKQSELQYYMSLMNQQLPIESHLMSRLADNLNAEIVLGNISNRTDGVEWLQYTYLFVRMLRSPGLYQVGPEYQEDEALEQKRVDLIHSAALILEKSSLVKYDKTKGTLQSTDLGRIASHYYITHRSMLEYNKHLGPLTSPVEMFRIFSMSEEFKYIPVRQDEKLELIKLLGRVPIPIKESVEEPVAKINVLLQAYISRLKLEGLALMADLVYVTQSAGRILRAIFEICMKKGWAAVARTALDLCKMAEKRMWPTMTPLRQFPDCPREVVSKAEGMGVPWASYFDLDPPRMGELLGMPKMGKTICGLVSKFPRLDVQAQAQPMTRSMLRLELTITPQFEWDDALHGTAENFWIVVEDCDGETMLFHDSFVLRGRYARSDVPEHLVEFTVPVTDPMPPNYFISLISDRWMHSETRIALPFQKLKLPEKFPPHTPVLDLQPLPTISLKRSEFHQLYEGWETFNKIQTQSYNSLFTTDDNVLVGASTGSGKTVCAEFAILRHWASGAKGRAIYVAPFQELVDNKLADWQTRLAHLCGGKTIVKLTGETTTDLRILEGGDLVLATPQQWDTISRQWRRRKNVQTARLFICDELHMIGGQGGNVYELIVSRMHSMALQLESDLRIIGLSVSLSNARDVGEWIGASKHNIYNFSPHVRSKPLELHIQSFNIPHFPSLMLAMAGPAYSAIVSMSPSRPALLFVANRKQARATAADLLSQAIISDDEDRFLGAELEGMQPLLDRVQEPALAEGMSHGIGYYHEALSVNDKKIVSHLFRLGALQVVVASRDVCWEIEGFRPYLVIVMGVQVFEGREHRYVDYPISEVLQMFGNASRGVLMVPTVKRVYYKKFLNEALPIESHLSVYLHDAFVSEITSGVISSTQDAVDWATYTYFYRRLLANPSYYGLTDTSHEGLSSHLSELVENTLKDLSEAKVIELDEEDDSIAPLNAAMIASYYNISYITIQTFLLSLNARTKLKGVLEIVTSATEFESIPIRRHEDSILRRIYDRCPVKMAQPSYESPHFKAFVLLQAHFSRLQLPVDLGKDQSLILTKVLGLLSGCVDVLSSEGHLNAMNAMELSQMVVQAMWDRDSPLLQIPHFSAETVAVANKQKVTDVFEFTDAMAGKKASKLAQALGLEKKHLMQAAAFANKYPNLDLEFEVEDPEEITAGSPAYLKIKIARDADDDDEEEEEEAAEPDTTVDAPFYPSKKTETWWLVVGGSNNDLLAIKKVSVGRELNVRLEFIVPDAGEHELTLYLMSDSYVGVDQDPTFTVTAAEGMDEDDDDDEEEEEGEDGDEE